MPHERVGVRQTGVHERIAGVLLNRFFKLFDRRLQPAVKPARPVEASFQIALVRSRILRVRVDQRLPRELGERDFEPVDDAPGDFILHGKHIGRAAVVTLRTRGGSHLRR